MKRGPVTPKGFRDIDPSLAQKRRLVIGKIADVLEKYGFLPLETPTVEFAETLTGKYGEEEKLIYKFKDRGGRDLALRYDLTVPLARFIANNLGLLNPSFSRYQVGQVFRGENPQRGRFREFTQFDFDCVGSSNLKDDAIIIAAAINAARKIGLNEALMNLNDRTRFTNIPADVVRAFDKLDKIGLDAVIAELKQKHYLASDIENFKSIITSVTTTPRLNDLFEILTKDFGLIKDKDFIMNPALARGLDYYTGIIFELKPSKKQEELSIGGGGRYDNLIGIFAGREIPAVGFSFGLDRLIELI